MPEKGPTPLPETPPEGRCDWVIPAQTQRKITRRLQDMLDPEQGAEYKDLRPRERTIAARVFCMFEALVKEQQRWDRFVKAGKPVFNWKAAVARAKEKENGANLRVGSKRTRSGQRRLARTPRGGPGRTQDDPPRAAADLL